MSPAPTSHQSQINSRKEKRMRKVDTFAPHNDGHQWRKYGEKKINNTNFPRSERMSISLSCFVSSSFVPEKKKEILHLPVL